MKIMNLVLTISLLITGLNAKATEGLTCQSLINEANLRLLAQQYCEKLCAEIIKFHPTSTILRKHKRKNNKKITNINSKTDIIQAPKSIIATIAETTENKKDLSPDYWLKLSGGISFPQFDLNNAGNSSKILSDGSFKIDVDNIFKLNPRLFFDLNLGMQYYSLETPPNQQLDHDKNTLFNLGTGLTWLQQDKWSLAGKIGYQHRPLFRGYTNPIINVDKFMIPYGEMKGTFFFYNRKSFKIGFMGMVGFLPGFTASLTGNQNYNIASSNYYDYGLVVTKELTKNNLELSILQNINHQKSDQGSQSESSVMLNVGLSFPLSWEE